MAKSRVNHKLEYVFEVKTRDPKTGKFNSPGAKTHYIQARGMRGVAILLHSKLDDVLYVNKMRAGS